MTDAAADPAERPDETRLEPGPTTPEIMATTGPGLPDEPLAPGDELPEPPSDEEVAAAARALGAPVPDAR